MTKTALISLLLLTSAPALAQQTQPAGPADTAAPTTAPASEQAAPPATTTTTPPAEQSAPATGSPTDQPAASGPTADQPTPDATQPTTSTGSDPAASGTQAADTGSSDPVAATVESDWAKYDSNKNDGLSRTEFNKWVTDLQTAADKKAPTKAYLSGAFRKADADKNKSVSKEELAAFLKG